VTHQAIVGQHFADEAALPQSWSDRLDFLNRRFPSCALAGQPRWSPGLRLSTPVGPIAWNGSRRCWL
jgi:hypothetical protein